METDNLKYCCYNGHSQAHTKIRMKTICRFHLCMDIIQKKKIGNHNSRHCNFLFPSLNMLLLYAIPSCGTSCKRMWVINVVQEVNPGFSSFGYLVWSQQVFLNTLVNIMLDGFYPRPLPRPILGVTLAHPINIHTAPFLLLTARDVTLPRKTFSVS